MGETAKELLVPERPLSDVERVTPEPGVVTVTEVEPTPPTKALIVFGVIGPSE